ncbi:MAG: hypothetical protein ACK47B_16825 [Armatimonadota bacterium]
MKTAHVVSPVLLATLLAVPAAAEEAGAPEPPSPPAPAAQTEPAAPAAAQPPAEQPPAEQPPVEQPPVEQPETPAGPQELTIGSVTISGQEFNTDPQTGQTIVTGDPKAVSGSDVITATRIIISPPSQFIAEGNVVIHRNGQVIKSQRLVYNFATREGQAEDSDTVFNQYYLDANQVFLRPGGSYLGRGAAVTTCDLDNPHYQFHARTVTIYPNDRMILEDIGVDLLGVRLATIPRYVKSLREEDEERRSWLPTFGYNSRDGLYAQKEFVLQRTGRLWLDADVRLNTSREPSLGLLAATPGEVQLVGALYYRDIADNQRVRFLQVSRLPEVGLVWTPRERPRTGRFLANQVPGVRRSEHLDLSREWILGAQLSAGYFQQHRGSSIVQDDSESKDGFRATLQAQGILPRVKLGPLELNDLRLLARQHLYDTGQAYTVFGTGIGKQWRFGNWRFRIDRFDQFTMGSTPFLFDDVELRQEWRPQITFETRGFYFDYSARIRGKNGELFDQIFTIGKLFHCIEPRLTYRVRRSEIGFQIRIPGLFGGESTVGEPRTSGVGDPKSRTEGAETSPTEPGPQSLGTLPFFTRR